MRRDSWRKVLVVSWLCLGLAASAAGCEEDTAAEGEPCDVAQDCDGSLVCAKVTADGDDKVCAQRSDTRDDKGCEREYENMTCGLVLKQAPDAGM